MYASSDDVTIEQVVSYTHEEKLNILVGASYMYSINESFQGYLERPFDPNQLVGPPGQPQSETPLSLANDDLSIVDSAGAYLNPEQAYFATYAQVYYRGKRLSVVGAIRYDNPIDSENDSLNAELSPKLGVYYLLGSKTRLRAFYGEGFRLPGSYFRDHNYSDDPAPAPGRPVYVQQIAHLPAEHFSSFEVGAIHDFNDKWRIEGQFFMHKLENSIFPVLNYPGVDSLLNWTQGPPTGPPSEKPTVGFESLNSESKLMSFQLGMRYSGKMLNVHLDGIYNIGEEQFRDMDDLDSYRSVPQIMAHLKVQARFKRGFHLALLGLYASDFTATIASINGVTEPKINSGYYNLDMVFGKRLSDHFTAYLRVNNLTRSVNKGIFSNHFTGYNFDYIPQYARTFRLGLNYVLN